MPEDPIDSPPTSDPPPIGGSGISKSIDDTTATTDTMQGYGEATQPVSDSSTTTDATTDTSTTDTTKVMPESDPPPIGGSG